MTARDDARFTPLTEALCHSVAAGRPDPQALDHLLALVRAQPLAAFPSSARRLRSIAWQVSRAAPGPVPALIAGTPGMAALFLHDPNGWHRDAALLRLDVPATPFDLAALLARLDDWVPDLRRLAETRLARLAPRVPAESIAQVLIARQGRIDSAWRISPVGHRLWQELVARDDVQERLLAHFLSDQGRQIRQVFLRRAEAQAGDAHLPRLAREAAHPSIRASALWWLMDGQVSYASPRPALVPGHGWQPVAARRPLGIPSDPAGLMQAAARDRSAQVRKVAAEMLRRYAQTDPGAAQALARQLADDRNSGVRARARWFLAPR